jgi:hypothetical protein
VNVNAARKNRSRFYGFQLTSTETISGLVLIEWDGQQGSPNAVAPR